MFVEGDYNISLMTGHLKHNSLKIKVHYVHSPPHILTSPFFAGKHNTKKTGPVDPYRGEKVGFMGMPYRISVVKCGKLWWGKVGLNLSRGLSPIQRTPDIMTIPNKFQESYPHRHIVMTIFIHILLFFYMFLTCGKLYLSPRW